MENNSNNTSMILGCGILKKEVDYLINKNKWKRNTKYIDSTLHIDFEKLQKALTYNLDKHKNENKIILYGYCHPNMDKMLEGNNSYKMSGQNCAEMILGEEEFTNELMDGAFFLLEEWAHKWTEILEKTFTGNLSIAKEIFKSDRKYLLALRTPVSGDFTEDAEKASKMVDLPLKWKNVELDKLELNLKVLIEKLQCQN